MRTVISAEFKQPRMELDDDSQCAVPEIFLDGFLSVDPSVGEGRHPHEHQGDVRAGDRPDSQHDQVYAPRFHACFFEQCLNPNLFPWFDERRCIINITYCCFSECSEFKMNTMKCMN